MQKGKVALITGGSKGIGLAIAQLFSEAGAKVIITGRNVDDLKKAADNIQGEVSYFKSDTANLQDIKLLMSNIAEKHQKIDTLIVNAGIAEDLAIEDVTEESFDRQININYKGAFFTVKESLPYLSDKASIIFIASVAATMGIKNSSVYSSTKAALVSLAKTLAADLAEKGIRVNAISPGYVLTPLGERNNKVNYQKICDSIPLERRFGSAEEIARVALFIASEATYMTGANVIVDGGLSSITL